MAKRGPGRPRIHPPKIPSGEDPQVTIGNQANQIKLLIERCQALGEELSERNKILNEVEESYQLDKQAWGTAYEKLNDLQLAFKRLDGWQDCAREIITMLIQGKA